MSVLKIIGAVLVILVAIFILTGYYTTIGPTHSALNQTASSLPNYFISILGSTFSGMFFIFIGLGFFSLGIFILSRS